MKLQSQTIKINRNGHVFQIDPDNPFVRYFGGGGSDIETLDPYAGTGYREMFKQFTDWLQPSVGAVTPYPGQMVPGQSGLQQAGFGAAQGLTPLAAGAQDYFGGMLGEADVAAPGRAMGMAETGLQDVMQPFDPSTVMEGLQPGKELALDTFFRDIVPALKESYVGRAGTADAGALNRAMAREGGRLSLGLGAQAMPYLFQGQQSQLGRQQQGVGQAMQMAGLPGSVLGQAGQVGGMGTDMLSQLLNIGGQQRGIAGEQMGEDVSKWQMQQPWASPWTGIMGQLQGAAPQMDYISQGQAPGLGSQMLGPLGSFMGTEAGGGMAKAGIGSLLGGAGGLAGGAAGGIGSLLALLSDERFKENIRPIKDALKKVKSLEGKTYNFKASPDRRDAGLIAQELEKVLPEAIIEHHDVKYVKYETVVALLVSAINELNEKIGA